MDVRKCFFSEGVLRYWNRMMGEAVESPFLEVFNKIVDVALRDVV